jgi:hypothetical protein
MLKGLNQFFVRLSAGVFKGHLEGIQVFQAEHAQVFESLQAQEGSLKAAIERIQSFVQSQLGGQAVCRTN